MARLRRRRRSAPRLPLLSWLPDLLAKSRLALIVTSLYALLGAAIFFGSLGLAAYRWYDHTYRWDSRIENRLESLRANVRIGEFDDVLGRARIIVPSDSGDSVQHIYQGRGHWVQAVANENGTVIMFAVTVCDEALHPAWKLSNSSGDYATYTLQRDPILFPSLESEYLWHFSGATANSYIYGLYGGGNPTNYQTYGWGYNDVCSGHNSELGGSLSPQALSVHWTSSPPDRRGPGYQFAEPTNLLPDEVRTGFASMTANTFVVYGITRFGDPNAHEFQIGADRILARTLDEP